MIRQKFGSGFTLIEAIVSIFIVAFVLVGMLRLYPLGNIQLEISRHKMMAVNLAQAEIENLKNTGYENILLSDYPLTNVVKIDTGNTSNSNDDINGTMTTQILSVTEGYKVIVAVSYNDYYGTINEVLESMIVSYL